jgi:hypothetical protein
MSRRRFTQDEDQKILMMSSTGKTFGFMARELARNPSSVKYRLMFLRSHSGIPVAAPRRSKAPIDLSGVVRCLGGCERQFHSPDRMRIRICPHCKRLQQAGTVHTAEYSMVGL